LADGTVATPDGNPNIYYTGDITEDLYIVIYHRNHLAVMSAIPLVEIFGTFAYDFTTGLSQAYLDGHKLLGGDKYGMIGGDSDGNGIVDMNDKDVKWTNDAGNAGYYGSDLNMDTQVNNPDKNDIWEENNGTSTPVAASCGIISDDLDGQVYTTVLIGDQCWMAENLNIGTMINGSQEMTENGTIEKYCYDDIPSNCDTYGGLYQWKEMMQYVTTLGAHGICPQGWHIPTNEEWKQLEGEVDSMYDYPDPEWNPPGFRGYDAGLNLKSTSGWNSGGNGTDFFGFTARPGGVRGLDGEFVDLGDDCLFWISDENNTISAWERLLRYSRNDVNLNYKNKPFGLSVRCLQN